MKNQILIIVFIFFIDAINAQQVLSNSNTGKGATPITISNNPLATKKNYAVVVGISDCQDKDIPDLRYADKDAEAFANFLRSPAGWALDGDHLKVLTNKDATMGQFAAALDWLWEVSKEGDLAIIYFSGHGDVEKKSITQPGYLLCWDAPSRVYGWWCFCPSDVSGCGDYPICSKQSKSSRHHRRLPLRKTGR
ncbi:MAG: caspase family protein [Saprospiraceae bacterium]|nr:caspase family protein [Candidatus Vicinibacter affinis]